MSTTYYIHAAIPQSPTKEIVSNIMTNLHQLNPEKMYHEVYDDSQKFIESREISFDKGIDIAWQELLKRNYSEFLCAFACFDEECRLRPHHDYLGIQHVESAYINFYVVSNGTRVTFSPGDLIPYKENGATSIHYDWYIDKLLKITAPYAIGELIAYNDYLMDERYDDVKVGEWRVMISTSGFYWAPRAAIAKNRTESHLKDIADDLFELQQKCLSKGYELIDLDILKLLKTDLPFVLPIKAKWGMAKLVLYEDLSIIPFQQKEKPVDLRPYIQVILDLTEGRDIYSFEAFNGIDYKERIYKV